jgi:hypothetical protein
MTTVKCAMIKCTSEYTTTESVSPTATFVCKLHTEASIRKELKFQRHQFDRELDGENKKSESQEYDRDWGVSGDKMLPGEKCEHGVYDPLEDQRYCSICNPVKIIGKAVVNKTKVGKVGKFVNRDEQIDQAISLSLFYHTMPTLQPDWFRDKELGFKSAAKNLFNPLLKKNKNFGRDQFLEVK